MEIKKVPKKPKISPARKKLKVIDFNIKKYYSMIPDAIPLSEKSDS